MMRFRWMILAPMLGLAMALPAVESTAPEGPLPEQADRRPSVLKPAYLFNMRGRRDPFINVNQWATAGSGIFSISALVFKGFIEVDGFSSALFVNSSDRAMYTLRGNRLFAANDKPVPGVSGRMLDKGQVRLRQGELSLNYSATRTVKRKI